jgi:hypothetical protein
VKLLIVVAPALVISLSDPKAEVFVNWESLGGASRMDLRMFLWSWEASDRVGGIGQGCKVKSALVRYLSIAVV